MIKLGLYLFVEGLDLLTKVVYKLLVFAFSVALLEFVLDGTHVVEAAHTEEVVELNSGAVLFIENVGYL
jgi:hypothetical protein